MSELSNTLVALLDFLRERGLSPPVQTIRVVEIGPDTPIDPRGRYRIQPADLREPHDYEERFDTLMKSGLPWINASCYGVHDDRLIVAFELPRRTSRVTARTSLNYSGPQNSVLDDGWSVEHVLAIAPKAPDPAE